MTDFSSLLSVLVPGAVAAAAAALFLDAYRHMKADQAAPFARVSQSALEKTYLEQLAPTETEVRAVPRLASLTGTAGDVTVRVLPEALSDAQLAIFDANVAAVARFAQQHRKCVRLDTAALCSVELIARAIAQLQVCPLDEDRSADVALASAAPSRHLFSGLVCRRADEVALWATRLSAQLTTPRAGETSAAHGAAPPSPLALPATPLTILLSSAPATAADLAHFFDACRAAQSCARVGHARPLICACAISSLDELDALQALLAAHVVSDLSTVPELTLLLDADLTYASSSHTVTAVTRVYRWGLGRATPAPPLRAPADVLSAQTSIASWNHAQRQHRVDAMAPGASAASLLPFLGLSGFLFTSRRTSVERHRRAAGARRTLCDYLRHTLRRWGAWLCWAALHTPVLYPLVRLARRRARHDAVVRVTELIQWYIFGSASFGDTHIYGPRPPGTLAMRLEAEEADGAAGKSAGRFHDSEFHVIEEEDLYVIHEGLPVVWQRPTSDEMRGSAGSSRNASPTAIPSSNAATRLYDKAREATEHAENVIPLTTDAETLVVVECTIGAKTLYRGLSATIPGLTELTW